MGATVADSAHAIATIRAKEGERPPADRLLDAPYATPSAPGSRTRPTGSRASSPSPSSATGSA
jgi:hypothetical protein